MEVLPNEVDNSENLLRAVYPASKMPVFWNGERIAPAAFVDPYGLSVDRTYDRPISQAVDCIKRNMQGFIVSVDALFCRNIMAKIVYAPSPRNIYHSEIHGGEKKKVFSDLQTVMLSRRAIIRYKPEYYV